MRITFLFSLLLVFSVPSVAQISQSGGTTKITGNTEINASAENVTAMASGSNSVAKNRVGVVQGKHSGNTRISAHVANITNVAAGNNRKSCVNIGSIVSDECK